MSPPVKPSSFARLVSALVIIALVATLARVVYFALQWSDLVEDARRFSWWEWGLVALFAIGVFWMNARRSRPN